MSEENNIIVSDALAFSKPNCPTRVGELVESVGDIQNIVTPRLGMQVYVKSEDKTYIITELESVTTSGVITPDAKVKSYKLYDPREVEKKLRNLIQGYGDEVDSRNDTFKVLGDFTEYDDNGLLSPSLSYQALDNKLKTLTYANNVIGSNYGYFRATVLNHRQVEIKNLLISSGENYIVQVVSGCFKISDNALAADDNNYCIATRILKKQKVDDETSTWGEWKVIVDSNSISSLETAITAEVNRATAAEQTITNTISTETDRAIQAESELEAKNQAEITRATNAEVELLKRIQGTSDNSNPSTDPFKYIHLGQTDDNMKTLKDKIDKLANIESIGFYRIAANNQSVVELHVIQMTSTQKGVMQVFKGPLRINNDSFTIDTNVYTIAHRYCLPNNLGEWKSIASTGGGGVPDDVENRLTEVESVTSIHETQIKSIDNTLKQEVQDRKAEDDKFKQGLFSVYPKMNIGGLREGAPPYTGTNNQAYSDLITGDGTIVLAKEFEIISYKYFENDIEILFDNSSKFDEFPTTNGLKLQIGVKRKDNGSFIGVNLNRIIQSCVFDKINIDNFGLSFDDYDCAGEYFISGNRKENTTDGLPSEIGAGNIDAKLTVFSKSKTKTGVEGANMVDFVAMQELTIVNADTGYGSVYQRIKHNGVWSEWEDIKGDDIPLATKVTWDASSNMNDFKTPGVYDIYGERTVKTDNLPITNDGSGHSIAARLTVVASTLQPANNEICITQFLQLSNRIGGEGNMYVRTYNENNNSMNGWTPWQKQMGMVETLINSNDTTVGQEVFSNATQKIGDGLNGMIDNGMYSGIYIDNLTYTGTQSLYYLSAQPTFVETFVLVVINDYAATGKLNLSRHITQLKYAVDAITGQSTVKKRVGTGNDTISWSDWVDVGGGGGSQEVDVTDAVKANGLPKLISQGFAKDGIVYSCKLKHDDIVGNMNIFDNGGKLSNFLLEKSGQNIENVDLKIEYKSGMSSFGNIYIDIYMYGQYYKAVINGSLFDRVHVSSDMTTL